MNSISEFNASIGMLNNLGVVAPNTLHYIGSCPMMIPHIFMNEVPIRFPPRGTSLIGCKPIREPLAGHSWVPLGLLQEDPLNLTEDINQ